MVSELVQGKELHQDVLQRVAAERRRTRKSESTEAMEAFKVGEYVLVARPRRR